MKDNRFIELLNLYIDRQISAAEAAELEAEMQAHPRRRATYRQYCQMHRATTLVYDSFRKDAPGQVQENGATVARFEGRRRTGLHWGHCAAGLAAACLAVVFVRVNSSQPAQPELAVAAARPAKPDAVVASVSVTPAPLREVEAPKAVFANLAESTAPVEPDYVKMLEMLRKADERAGFVQPSRVSSLFNDGVFDSQQGMPANGSRIYRDQSAHSPQVLPVVFEFQR